MSTKHGGKGGAIVNVSSMAATLGGRPGSSAYAATKGAVDSFTKGFAREVAPRRHPGELAPARHGADRDDREAGSRTRPSATTSRRRSRWAASARRGEIADAVLWLLSDEAAFITGAMLDAAGGGYII